jgi:Uma2 family endonuclease
MVAATVTAPAAPPLLTAEEYAKLPDTGVPTELVRGRVIEMNLPAPRHGEICWKVASLVGIHAESHGLGRVVVNDSGVVTGHDPDTVRGADVAFYSYARVPRGPLPAGYLDVVPELVFEVRSPTDRWSRVFAKAMEYLEAGVTVVCILDQMSERVLVCRAEEMPLTLQGDEELHLPDILGEFRVAVRRFFE